MMKPHIQIVIKTKRDAIAKRSSNALSNYKNGAIKKGDIKYLYKDFENVNFAGKQGFKSHDEST